MDTTHSKTERARRITDKRGTAQHLKYCDRYVDILREKHGLPCFKLGRSIRFDLNEVDAWLEQFRNSSTEPQN